MLHNTERCWPEQPRLCCPELQSSLLSFNTFLQTANLQCYPVNVKSHVASREIRRNQSLNHQSRSMNHRITSGPRHRQKHVLERTKLSTPINSVDNQMYLPQRSIIFHNRCHHKCHATIGVIINTTSLVILFTYLHINKFNNRHVLPSCASVSTHHWPQLARPEPTGHASASKPNSHDRLF